MSGPTEEELQASAMDLVEKIDLAMPGLDPGLALERALSAVYGATILNRGGISQLDAAAGTHAFFNTITAGIELQYGKQAAVSFREQFAQNLLTGPRKPLVQPTLPKPRKDAS